MLCCLCGIGGVHALEVEFLTLDTAADLAVSIGALNLNLAIHGFELCMQLNSGFQSRGQFGLQEA